MRWTVWKKQGKPGGGIKSAGINVGRNSCEQSKKHGQLYGVSLRTQRQTRSRFLRH